MQNFYLIVAVTLLGYMIFKRFALAYNKNVKNVSPEEANKLITEKNEILILDVRTPSEFKSGHIKGAKSFPVDMLATSLKQLEAYKDKPVLVHCASGGRSPAAVKLLLKNDFKKIYHMNHGLKGWKYGLK